MASVPGCELRAGELEPFSEGKQEKVQQIELKWKRLPRSCLTSYPQVGGLKIVPL